MKQGRLFDDVFTFESSRKVQESSLKDGRGPALSIGQRRYLGNKQQLISFISRIIEEHCGTFDSLGDFFAGTGVVSSFFNRADRKIISNELLYSNVVCLNAFLKDEPLDKQQYDEVVRGMVEASQDILSHSFSSYFAKEFGGRYFSLADAAAIHHVREWIANAGLKGRLKDAAIATLLYSVDRIAHTCGHYDAYRAGVEDRFSLIIHPLAIDWSKKNTGNLIVHGRAIDACKHYCDVVYLDPPYNSRQYCDSYHLLENLALWNKPLLKGKARKFDRSSMKSRFNLKSANAAMAELVDSLRCKCIVLSYSNMEGKGDSRSANRLSAQEISKILSRRGEVSSYDRSFKPFSTGKGNIEDHREILYVCRVTKEKL